jgi:hypothetical protein
MSLYTPPSTIRRLILEAEDLTLSPNTQAQETQQFTDQAASPTDVMSDMTAAAVPQQGTPGLQGSTLTMPQVAKPQTTVSKTVINRDIILSQLAELKSVITNYEKKFDGDDLTPDDANVYISSLLSTLVFHAERFNTFMESDEGAGAAPEAMLEPELPLAEEPLPAMPETLPEAGLEAPLPELATAGPEAQPQV